MKWSDPGVRIAANLLLIAFVLFVSGYFFGAGKELAAAVVGGLLAVLGPEVARFMVRARLTKPEMASATGRIVQTRMALMEKGEVVGSTVSRYVQVPVVNMGSASARASRAYLSDAAFRPDAHAEWTPIGGGEPVPLMWGVADAVEISIPPRVPHYVNVVRAIPGPYTPEGSLRADNLQVCGPSVPFTLADRLRLDGLYRLLVVVAAENSEPYACRVTVAWKRDVFSLELQQEH